MNRRGFLGAILASGVAPYVITTPGLLMPVRSVSPFLSFPAGGKIGPFKYAALYSTDSWAMLNDGIMPSHGHMTAAEVIARREEFALRQAWLACNPPIIVDLDLPPNNGFVIRTGLPEAALRMLGIKK